MRHYYLFLLLFALPTVAQNVQFDDPNLKSMFVNNTFSLFGCHAKDINGNNIAVDANNDNEIQLTEALAVYDLDVSNAVDEEYPYIDPVFTTLGGIESFTNLKVLSCNNHNITALNLVALTNLEELYCHNNLITSLTVNGLANLKTLDCADNLLTALNLSGLTGLQIFYCTHNTLATLSFTGLTSLQDIDVSYNPLLGLNPAGLTNLTRLYADSCNLTALPLTGLTSLVNLSCGFNPITALDLSGLVNLQLLNFQMCQVANINLQGLPALNFVRGFGNPVTSLDLSFPNNLQTVMFEECGLNFIDLSACSQLSMLYVDYNSLPSIDVSACPALTYLSAMNNTGLQYVNLKNGTVIQDLYLLLNTQLQYICVDEDELAFVQNAVDQTLLNCEVNTYCSFTPGGEVYQVAGTVLFDEDANGCNSTDAVVPNLVMNITGSGGTGTLIPNNTGNYSIYVTGGSHTFTPVNPNPAYYTLTPASTTVDFDTVSSPYALNFCLGAVGVFKDLEVTVLPLTAARPGFDASYRLIYKNNGTTTLAGTVALNYMDNVLDFVSATVIPSGNSFGQLTWDFTNLHPFEERSIDFVLNVNSPLEVPAININDVLNFTATVSFDGTDETPQDNTHTISQVVVGSLDPNDKICVEGATITPNMVGEYVTYIIRFENTGTYPAQNIVVKDVLDAAKFDVSTLTPLQGSHEFITRVSGNTAEFILENIMLPGAPNNDNHGFVAFKIKTLPTLSLNDSFSNTAQIYFDYNAPVVTNQAQTTVALLSTTDFDFKNYITLYPNPAGSTLHLDAKAGFEIKNVMVYNMLGQQLLSVVNTGNNSAVDVSSLAAGSYFIKVSTNKGMSSGKFIKK